VAVAVAATLGGCGPDPAQVQADAQLAYEIVVGTSTQAVDRLSELYPDVTFRSTSFPSVEDRWTACGSMVPDRRHPAGLWWDSRREVVVEPPRETATLAAGLVQTFEDDGWTVYFDQRVEWGHSFRLHREGLKMWIWSIVEPGPEHAAVIDVSVFSGCMDAPEDQGQWEWTPGPTEPPWPPESADEHDPNARR